jgi:hypothetical protein
MNRGKLNFVLDSTAAILMITLAATGLITRFVLPQGSGQWRSLWGLTRHQWGDIHFWLAALLVLVLITHVALHWNWVGCVISNWKKRADNIRNNKSKAWSLMGWIFLLMLVVSFAAFSFLAKQNVDEKKGSAREHSHSGRGQRGR